MERDDADDTPERIEWLLHLAAPGSALGGARPKASIRDVDQSLWLAKFPSNDDRHDIGLWEYITCRLARMAGIDMPEARIMRLSERGTLTSCVASIGKATRVALTRRHSR